MSNEQINLGQHIASIDEATGELSISDKDTTTKLSPGESYNLLTWLHDYHRDRLYQKMHDPSRDVSEKQWDAGKQP